MKLDLHQTWTPDDVKTYVAWFDETAEALPSPVRVHLKSLRDFLASHPDPSKCTRSESLMLLRAMGFISSSEKRRSGSPLGTLPPTEQDSAKSLRQKHEESLERSKRLADWHEDLGKRHHARTERLSERLSKMADDDMATDVQQQDAQVREVSEETPLEDIQLTDEQRAESKTRARQFVEHLQAGDDADPAFASVNETLMPGGSVLGEQKHKSLAAEIPESLVDGTVVQTLHDTRVRYDFSMTVTRVELDVEKKVVSDRSGKRHVISASTAQVGPPRYAVTWSALATLAVMVGQFAIPLNRLATMLSAAGKRFTAGGLSRMLRYVAVRFFAIYIELARQVADSDIICGDDTPGLVLEVSTYFKKEKTTSAQSKNKEPPWAGYRTPAASERSLQKCNKRKQERLKRRREGDRAAKRTPGEEPSLAVLIGRHLAFESPRRNGDGAKQSLNTTVLSARSIADDPTSLIVLYRSHLGSFGNLLESILRWRNPTRRDVSIQGDLSTTNLVTDAELLQKFRFHLFGCSAHARRPFALYEHEDPVNCSYMLHLFQGLAIHESRLDVHGRNRQNVLAVRQNDSRRIWEQIKALALLIKSKWPKATKLGIAARYILKHFKRLTAYLDDARLEATNNMRERMLRLEKLIQGSSMFRRSLEGRFVLDVIRTILQTAVAANVPVHKYIVFVLRADPSEIAEHPERFTPHAYSKHLADDTETSLP